MRILGNRISKPSPRWALWRWYDIVLGGVLYLTRLNIFQVPLFSTKLHWIHRPDPDRDLHDHPWPFVSIVLWGGYEEYESKNPRSEPGKLRKIRWFNYKNTRTAHRISKVKPRTLTLIFSGPRSTKKEWGFFNEHTFEYTDWKTYENIQTGKVVKT